MKKSYKLYNDMLWQNCIDDIFLRISRLIPSWPEPHVSWLSWPGSQTSLHQHNEDRSRSHLLDNTLKTIDLELQTIGEAEQWNGWWSKGCRTQSGDAFPLSRLDIASTASVLCVHCAWSSQHPVAPLSADYLGWAASRLQTSWILLLLTRSLHIRWWLCWRHHLASGQCSSQIHLAGLGNIDSGSALATPSFCRCF